MESDVQSLAEGKSDEVQALRQRVVNMQKNVEGSCEEKIKEVTILNSKLREEVKKISERLEEINENQTMVPKLNLGKKRGKVCCLSR